MGNTLNVPFVLRYHSEEFTILLGGFLIVDTKNKAAAPRHVKVR